MKKLISLLFLAFAVITVYGQTPFEDSFLTDTTDGGTDTITTVIPGIFESKWLVTYQAIPTETGDSLHGTIKLQEAPDPAGTNYQDLAGRSLTMTDGAITTPFLTDTTDQLKHRVWFETTDDTGDGFLTCYYWARPYPNIKGLSVIKKTFSALTFTNTSTQYFTLPQPLNGQYQVEWQIVTTRSSGTASATITLQESCSAAGTSWSDAGHTASITNLASQIDNIKAVNKGKRVRLKVASSGTMSLSIVVYCVAKPIYN